MILNSIIKTEQLCSDLICNNKICFFVSYIDFDNLKIYEFRNFLRDKHVSFIYLYRKQLYRIFKLILQNDVVLTSNNKNFDLACINIFLLFLDNFFMFIYIINYINYFYKKKLNLLYLKVNNCFFTVNYLETILKIFFFANFKNLTFSEFKNILDYESLLRLNNFKMLHFKFYLLFKIFLLFKISNNLYIKII